MEDSKHIFIDHSMPALVSTHNGAVASGALAAEPTEATITALPMPVYLRFLLRMSLACASAMAVEPVNAKFQRPVVQ